MDEANSTSGGGSPSSPHQVPMFTLAVLYLIIVIAGTCCALFAKTRRYGLVLLTALAILYNVHYILDTSSALRYMVSVGDVLVNLPESLRITSVDSWDAVPAGLTTCEDCSYLDYTYHALFMIEFYDSVTNNIGSERLRLLIHIFFNSLALGLVLVQFLNYSSSPRTHKRVGYAVIICTSIGTSFALWIGFGHSRKAYGYDMEPCGWSLMGGSLLASMYLALYYARKGDYITHGRWMVRFYGGLWGSYFLWRILGLAGALLFRSHEYGPALIMYFSTPLGILLADLLDKRSTFRSAREADMRGKLATIHKADEQEDEPVNEPTTAVSNMEDSDIIGYNTIESPPPHASNPD